MAMKLRHYIRLVEAEQPDWLNPHIPSGPRLMAWWKELNRLLGKEPSMHLVNRWFDAGFSPEEAATLFRRGKFPPAWQDQEVHDEHYQWSQWWKEFSRLAKDAGLSQERGLVFDRFGKAKQLFEMGLEPDEALKVITKGGGRPYQSPVWPVDD